jgi:hypothetical protein
MRQSGLLIIIILFGLYAQSQCTIWCRDDAKKKPKNIAFHLVLEPVHGVKPVISSDRNGVLWIGKKSYNKLKSRRVMSFQFADPMMHQYYAEPYLLKSQRVLFGSLCGRTLIVTTNW